MSFAACHFGTKTPYHPPPFTTHFTAKRCATEKVFVLARHGSRSPTRKVSLKVATLSDRLPGVSLGWEGRFPLAFDRETPAGREGWLGARDKVFGPGHRNATRERQASSSSSSSSPSSASSSASSSQSSPSSSSFSVYGELVSRGAGEMRGLGGRLAARFPDLFGKRVFVRASRKDRAIDSAVAFFDGVRAAGNGSQLGRLEAHIGQEEDHILRFFDSCEAYKDHKSYSVAEAASHPVVAEALTLVDAHVCSLGEGSLFSPVCGDHAALKVLWEACLWDSVLETPRAGRVSACDAFPTSRLREAMETAQDVEAYLAKGPAYELNYLIACPSVREMLRFLAWNAQGDGRDDDPEEEVDQADESWWGYLFGDFDMRKHADREHRGGPGEAHSVLTYFAHAETLLPVLSLLGVMGKDPVLDDRASTLEQAMHNRTFRTSWLSPFGGNLVILQDTCHDGVWYRMELNERPVTVPACHGRSRCPYGELFLPLPCGHDHNHVPLAKLCRHLVKPQHLKIVTATVAFLGASLFLLARLTGKA
jgi:hypothetical protein